MKITYSIFYAGRSVASDQIATSADEILKAIKELNKLSAKYLEFSAFISKVEVNA